MDSPPTFFPYIRCCFLGNNTKISRTAGLCAFVPDLVAGPKPILVLTVRAGISTAVGASRHRCSNTMQYSRCFISKAYFRGAYFKVFFCVVAVGGARKFLKMAQSGGKIRVV